MANVSFQTDRKKINMNGERGNKYCGGGDWKAESCSGGGTGFFMWLNSTYNNGTPVSKGEITVFTVSNIIRY